MTDTTPKTLELRDYTGACIQDCRKALELAGSFELAAEMLRIKYHAVRRKPQYRGLKEENERLREALEDISTAQFAKPQGRTQGRQFELIARMKRMAKQALETTRKEGE